MSSQATAKEKYDQIFIQSFSLEPQQLASNPTYNQIPTWDSVGHMNMIANLESTFEIALETDDIIGFSSYQKGFEIVSKYGVQFN